MTINLLMLFVVTLICLAVRPYAHTGPLLLLFSATVFGSLFSGLLAGGITAIVAATIHTYFFQMPHNTFSISTRDDVVEIVIFLGMSFVVGWFGSIIHSAQLRAEHLAQEAEDAVQAREDLLAIVAHDLKNPLNAIQLNVQVAERSEAAQASTRVCKSLENIAHTSSRMLKLISDLLDYERVRVGTLRIEPKPEDVGPLLMELRDIMAPLVEQKSQQLIVQPGGENASVLCDRERVIQVFSNLVGNAIKFTSHGGKIIIGSVVRPENVEFFVRDNGPGIPEEQLKHVFDRYWQARHASRQGVGLGLSIVKGIIHQHRGQVWCESALSEGTTFFFTLPRTRPAGLTQARQAS